MKDYVAYTPVRPSIVAVTLGSMDNPTLVCVEHVIGVVRESILGEFEEDDLEPGESCQANDCHLLLAPYMLSDD